MPPRGVKSSKRKRQYEHIKESEQQRGRSTKRAKEIAARTVNKQRSEAGESRSRSKRSSSSTSKASSSRKKQSTSKKKSASRKR